jgi:hypothetical protein
MLILISAIAGIFGFVAAAEMPVALVEEVKGTVPGVEFMDYVPAGEVIELGAKDTIVLGYLRSCWREIITGGIVVVGEKQSAVSEGKIQRIMVNCDSNQGGKQASYSGGKMIRGAPQAAPQPQLTIYGLSPLVEGVTAGGRLIIERLDKPGERYDMLIGASSLLRGRFYDFAKSGKALAREAIYVARLGEKQIVFKVDAQAKPGATPMVGRLVRFD